MIMACFVIGGLALDVANAYKARTEMQAAADAAAHAALYVRDSADASTAKTAALDVVEAMLPSSKYGTLLTDADIHFGSWDATNRQFAVDDTSDDAVWVDISRLTSKSNPVGTYFLKFTGITKFDIRRGAVFETYRPNCFKEGMVGQGIVDAQSNNVYTNGFCIHSQSHVEVNSGNTFDTGTSVTMPDDRDLVIPSSGMTSNDGLSDAVDSFSYQIRVLNKLEGWIDDLYLLDPDVTPDYITQSTTITLSSRNVSAADFTPGYVHTASCVGNQQLFIQDASVLSDIVLVTDCKIKFGADTAVENSIIATTNTGDRSMNAPSSLVLGDNDGCTDGGGVTLLTMGGVEFAADLHVYGSRIIAMGDIYFRANATGIEGASFISGGEIDGTSNSVFGFCGGAGMDDVFEAEYFRLVS